mgnify:CR=1 FL=1
MGEPDSYFVRIAADRLRATPHTAGAWSTSEQHFSRTVLHDENGPVGRAEQTLTIRAVG